MDDRTLDQYGISRIEQGGDAWRVSLCRQGQRFVRNFHDSTCGGREAALEAARQYRDEIICNHPPTSRRQFAEVRRRNNRTGITGVYRFAKRYRLRDGTQRETWYWEANWPTERGKSGKATFSVNRYGEDLARQLAIRARAAGLAAVEGVFWASEPALEVARENAETAVNPTPQRRSA